jgi:hypothetical protein
MTTRLIAASAVLSLACLAAPPPEAATPILKVADVKPGMQGKALTVFSGAEPEEVPIEVLGVLNNALGPRQHLILAKMGGKAVRTNVAGGMSGSPVYIDGKLVGAIGFRMSVFSPDAICGITPIEQMLEIDDFDQSRPADARVPDQSPEKAAVSVPGELMRNVSAGGTHGLFLTPIETPITFSGFHEATLHEFSPFFRQNGIAMAQGGASASLQTAKLAPGWQNALKPGEAVSGVLVSGDMSMTVMGTVTYNDGEKVLAFGHPFLKLGPVSMPMARSEVVMTLASAFQPNKFGNATEIVGTFRQDRQSGVLGRLGEESEMIPVKLKIRTFGDGDVLVKEKDLKFQVFVQQRWTPFLMMVTLFNGVSGLNDFADESTYRLSGDVELEGDQKISLSTMFAPSEMPIPTPMLLAGWWGEKFNRLFLNAVQTPKLKSVNATLDLLPQRRIATIESAWLADSEVEPGAEVPLKVYLRPYRGDRIEKQVTVKIPAGAPKGSYRILVSDADTLNRVQTVAAGANRFIDLPQTVSVLNQERTNTRMYVSLVQARPTVYYDDKTMPSLPGSVANVMQNGRAGSRAFVTSPESLMEQMALPFDMQISGSASLRIAVR